MEMPINDDDAAGHGGGKLSKMFNWLWNYPVTGLHMNGLVFFLLTHIVVGVICALAF
jgi:hypothetical protein